jgi:hypothetical protein
MTAFELVSAADVQLMQGPAHRATPARPELVDVGISYGEPARICGHGSTRWKGGALHE